MQEIITGDGNTTEIITIPNSLQQQEKLTFEQMKSMPVVHFSYLDYSVYLDPEHHAFSANIFVALQ